MKRVYTLSESEFRQLVRNQIRRLSNNPNIRRLHEAEVNWDDKYESFIAALAGNAKDPKVKAFISAGELDDDATDDKFTFGDKDVPVTSLIPTQNEIDIDKSLAYPISKPKDFINYVVNGDGATFSPGGPIVTYNGKYIIDGHHRWSQVYACNKNAKMKCLDIQIEGLKPLEVLKAVQASIAYATGKVPIAEVKGTNLLAIDKSGLEGWFSKAGGKNLNFFAEVGANDSCMKKMKESIGGGVNEAVEVDDEVYREAQQLAVDYIWSNCESMKSTSQPVDGAPKRSFMPQVDNGGDWQSPLEQGKIDIVSPHAAPEKISKSIQSSGYQRSGYVVVERWQRLAGILKG